MLPTSHHSPTGTLEAAPVRSTDEAALLADAFSAFIEASGRLEGSYRELQTEVAQLGSELAARNAALESSLRENEQMRTALVEIVDSMPCGILVLGTDERILRINPEARRLLELSAGLCDGLVAGGDLAGLAASAGVNLRPFCNMGGACEFSVAPVGTAEGLKRRWIQMHTRRLAEQSEGAHTILILTDVSAHKEAERDREEGRRAVALAEVAATLAHEIRNPLAGLELFASLLESEPERSADWLTHLRAGLRSLTGTVSNVLAYHCAGSSPLRPVRLAAAARSAAEFVRPLTEQAGLHLHRRGEEIDGMVSADEQALQQLVLNLVINAVRHTPDGGSIEIAVSRSEAGRLRLSVTDTGSGIAAEHLPHIFRAGWSANGAGTGLGLAVCRRIAEQHAGVLRVESIPGEGTTFQLELPSL